MKRHETFGLLNVGAIADRARSYGGHFIICPVCEKAVRPLAGVVPPLPTRHKKAGHWCDGGFSALGSRGRTAEGWKRHRAEVSAKKAPTRGRYAHQMEIQHKRSERRRIDAEDWIERVRARKKAGTDPSPK